MAGLPHSTTPPPGGPVDVAVAESLALLAGLPGVVRAGLALTEGGGRRLHFTASDRRGPLVDWCLIDAYDDVPLTAVVRTGEVLLGDLDELEGRFHGVVAKQREAGIASIAAVPLVADGPPVGGLVLFYGIAQRFDPEQRLDLVRRAMHIATTVRAAQAAVPRTDAPLAAQPVPEGARVVDVEVEPDPRAVGTVRRAVRHRLQEWEVDDDVADDALLCLSEVVTNAVVHTGSPSELRVTLDRGVLTVVLRDAGTRHRPTVPSTDLVDPLRVHGRGLALVEELTDRWGSELDAAGTTVWFALELARRPVTAGSA
ncbi:ATP-binding protein [Nocardioides nanhaiensis]|uniref:Histidine kinase/HSP90-like ATPase domain-containing protein n=1 Tax=Nocardioides nanhaiensis TaxID=1476871 RepID=A0ABP8WBW3_9ACTN